LISIPSLCENSLAVLCVVVVCPVTPPMGEGGGD
jgi:hypothetical protein